jgi:hypothetical protein
MMNELTNELQDLLDIAIREEKYAAADYLSKTLQSRREHPVFGETPPLAVLFEMDPTLQDWAPGCEPIWRKETPGQMMARQSQWPRWRKTLGQFFGVYIGP